MEKEGLIKTKEAEEGIETVMKMVKVIEVLIINVEDKEGINLIKEEVIKKTFNNVEVVESNKPEVIKIPTIIVFSSLTNSLHF